MAIKAMPRYLSSLALRVRTVYTDYGWLIKKRRNYTQFEFTRGCVCLTRYVKLRAMILSNYLCTFGAAVCTHRRLQIRFLYNLSLLL